MTRVYNMKFHTTLCIFFIKISFARELSLLNRSDIFPILIFYTFLVFINEIFFFSFFSLKSFNLTFPKMKYLSLTSKDK